MEKELETANEMASAETAGGLDNVKEVVYNILENVFTWLSTHQGLALIILLVILVIIIWLILSPKKYRKQMQAKLAGQKKEMGKKEALIEDQKNKLTALQKRLSDQQTVASEAMLRTMTAITGYDTNQLQSFFKFLTQISGNPLQLADPQTNTMPESQRMEDDTNDDSGKKDADTTTAAGAAPEEAVKVDKSTKE